MSTDPIDALLRADEEELKAKRGRLRAFARAVETAREAIATAQETGEAIASSDGLSRADIARTFDLSGPEKSLFVPSRRRRSGSSEAVDEPTAQGDDSGARPEDELDRPGTDHDDGPGRDDEQRPEQGTEGHEGAHR